MKRLASKVLVITMTIIAATYLLSAVRRGLGRSSSASMIAASSFSGSSAVADSGSAAATSTLDDINRLIRDTEVQLNKTPTSSSYDLVARLLLSRGRITGDAQSYVNAQQAAERSLAIAPRNPEAQTIAAEVLYTNHEFKKAQDLSRKISDTDQTQLGALAIYGDSLRELGEYQLASVVLDRLQQLAPNAPSVTVRRARLAVLRGDPTTAQRLAEQAEGQAQKSGLLGPTLAFYSSFLGQLAQDRGDYRAAAGHYRDALGIADGDRIATLGLARALASAGQLTDAELPLKALTERYPEPASLILLEDVQHALGDDTAAKQTGELIEATASLGRANQQIYNRELAVYYANHDIHLDEALRLARAEIRQRKDIFAYDTLAWAEYKSGNFAAAMTASNSALATGIQDAAVLYHAGLIAIASGNNNRGSQLLSDALKLNPSFDIRQAPLAKAALKSAAG